MRSFNDILLIRAARQPGAIAYRFLRTGDADGEVDQVTYGELGRRARAIGVLLAERGLAGRRALLLYPPGLEFIPGYLGCLLGAVVPVPCPAPLGRGRVLDRTLRRLRRLAADADADAVPATRPVIS